jgi:hypothetical protein
MVCITPIYFVRILCVYSQMTGVILNAIIAQGISQCLITARITLATQSGSGSRGGIEANVASGYGLRISNILRHGDNRVSFKTPSVSDESVLNVPAT